MSATLWNVARGFVAVVAFALVANNLAMVGWYTHVSLDIGGTSTEMPEWTSARAVAQLRQINHTGSPQATIVSDASTGQVAVFEAATLTGRPLLFFQPYFRFEPGWTGNIGDTWARPLGKTRIREKILAEIKTHNRFYDARVNIKDGDGGPNLDEFILDPRLLEAVRHPAETLLLKSFNQTLFNNWTHPGTYIDRFALVPYASVQNYLVYIPSGRGEYNRGVVTKMISRFEPDTFVTGRNMEGVGRYLLFHVVNPAKHFRLELDYTATIQGDGQDEIPPAQVIGKQRYSFPTAGRGAARVFSPLITPQLVQGLPVIEVDMGKEGTAFQDYRSGVMTLFGRDELFDNRHIVGFIRDISIVPDSAYRSMRAPQAIAIFPAALEDPHLEFSGIYEDGWIADRASAWLSAPKKHRCTLTLRAFIPAEAVSRSFNVQIAIDGNIVSSVVPSAGDILINVNANGDGLRHKVDITTSSYFRLVGADRRPASIRLMYLGFH